MADGVIQSGLLAADWNGEWMRLQADRRRADDSFEWDKRARHFRPLRLPRMPGLYEAVGVKAW